MNVTIGSSAQLAPLAAVEEAIAAWPSERPDIVFVFVSSKQDPAAVAQCLQARVAPRTVVVGCTTSGEFTQGTHTNGSLAIAALFDSGITWSARAVHDLSGIDTSRARGLVDDLLSDLGTERDEVETERHFALLFIDGMRLQEEVVAAELAEALDGIQLVGGSAGDDLTFSETRVILGDQAPTDAAILVVGRADTANVDIIKHQHFSATGRLLAVTRADPTTRTVYEIDGRPAMETYAAALGLPTEQVTSDVTILNPVTFACEGELYVRSIQRITDEGALVFYCAIEEGMVMDIASHQPMAPSLADALEPLHGAEFLLVFNCILRSLEAESSTLHDDIATAYRSCGVPMIGFDTYGEQLNGMHINQTLVALAISAA